MNRFGRRIALALGLFCTTVLAETENERPIKSLKLRDGSTLTAVVDALHVPMTTPYGDVEVPVSMIRLARIAGDGGVQAELSNGDRLTGRITATNLQVSNALGRLAVPWVHVSELGVAPGSPVREHLTTRPVTTSPIRLELFLRDGSCVLGTPKKRAATFRSVLGKCTLPWSLVRGVTFHNDKETSTVRFWSGDSIVGCVDWKSCPIGTKLGPVRVSSVAASRVEVSLGGIDLVEKSWTGASGNKHFLSAIRNDGPMRIGGRIRPSSQFIAAHAGGRLEFEFDRPVTEFRAIATMWESYGAHKGSVVFRVETEHGEVCASRMIRNMGRQELYARFAPARRLVLVTNECGNPEEDWSVWLWPEVR